MKMICKLFFIIVAFLLVFTACSSVKTSLHPNAVITDTHWSLVSVSSIDGGQLLYPDADKMPTLDVAADGKSVSGNAGCNSYSGPVTMKDFSIQFGAIIATRMYCEDSNDIESALLNAYKIAKEFTVKEEQLILVDSNNNIVATFSQVKK